MKKMVEKITVNVGAGEVSYHGATVRTELSASNLIGFASKKTFTTKPANSAPAPKREMPHARQCCEVVMPKLVRMSFQITYEHATQAY